MSGENTSHLGSGCIGDYLREGLKKVDVYQVGAKLYYMHTKK